MEEINNIIELNEKLKILDEFNSKCNHLNVEEYQRNTAGKKQMILKSIITELSKLNSNNKFIIDLNYQKKDHNINKYKFNIEIRHQGKKIFSTYFYSMIPYIGYDVFEYLIRHLVKSSDVDILRYDNILDSATISNKNIVIYSKIPERYLEQSKKINENKNRYKNFVPYKEFSITKPKTVKTR